MALYMSGNTPDGESEKTRKSMSETFGPQMVDQMMRQAMSTCWMMLPERRKNAQELKSELQRILDRLIADFQEDAKAFGFDVPPTK